MKRKIVAVVLVMASVMSLASCSLVGKLVLGAKETDETGESTDSKITTTEGRIYSAVDKIAKSLADCDYDTFEALTVGPSKAMKKSMPVLMEDDKEDYTAPKLSEEWKVRNMIANTITYEIVDGSYKGGVFGGDCKVDVMFSYKDYKQVLTQRDEFLGAAEFNTILYDVTDTINTTVTLVFTKKDGRFLLDNPDDLLPVYDYKLGDIKFMKNIFDMVKTIYMEGDNWDPITESYVDADTFTIVFVLDNRAKNYTWQYIYRVMEKTSSGWSPIYTSTTINDRNPSEIRITYKQDTMFKAGYYCFFMYDPQSKSLYGMEFDVYNTAEGAYPPNATQPSFTEPSETEPTETSDATEPSF